MPHDETTPTGEPDSARDLDVELWPGESIHVESAQAAAEARHFRDVLGRFPTGVTVAATAVDGVPVGLTCQSFLSVSLSPPLVMVAVAATSRAWPLIRRAGCFCVTLLAADQVAVSERMASGGTDKFAGVAWSPSSVTGSPVISGGIGHVDCRIHAVHEAGDHWLVVGRVVDLVAGPADQALTYFRGRYGSSS